MIRSSVIVYGLVQGVGFRWWTRREAERLGVSGWVSNRSDGAVEAEIEGEADAVAALLAWLRIGPDQAQVDRIEIAELVPSGERGFRIAD